MSMARASPHHPSGHIRPQQCPACNESYQYRYHGPSDKYRTAGYACTHYGYTYVHQPAEHPTGVLRE